METAFLFTLTTIFIIESVFEVRYYAQVRTIFSGLGELHRPKESPGLSKLKTCGAGVHGFSLF